MPADPPHDDLSSIWRNVTAELAAGLPPSTFQLWIDPLRAVGIQGATLYVAAPETTRAWVERRYTGMLETALHGQDRGLERIVLVRVGNQADHTASASRWTTVVESLPLDSRHTFERFVIGDGNRLAHAAALAVAELPGEAYNPLFLHGPPGLGKTHLLGAIGNYLRGHRLDLNVHYTTAERFTTEFVSALRKDGPERFKERYRGLDALLIDDVQALEGKEHTQEEFVHTFNTLHAAGKQIVLSSDRPPEALARLAERLRDRFRWGLCAQLEAPDLRTRTALLWRMALEAPTDLTEPIVLGEIASRAAGNIRRLEGAMTRVVAVSSVLGKPITTALVRRALTDPGEANAPDQFTDDSSTVLAIQEAACTTLGVSRADLLSTKRTARVTQARQIAIYLTRQLTSLSLNQIASHFNRDHSTVLHAIRAITTRLEPGSQTAELLDRTRSLLPPQHQGHDDPTAPLHPSAESPRPSSTNPTGASTP